jgi:hypothetical protein
VRSFRVDWGSARSLVGAARNLKRSQIGCTVGGAERRARRACRTLRWGLVATTRLGTNRDLAQFLCAVSRCVAVWC